MQLQDLEKKVFSKLPKSNIFFKLYIKMLHLQTFIYRSLFDKFYICLVLFILTFLSWKLFWIVCHKQKYLFQDVYFIQKVLKGHAPKFNKSAHPLPPHRPRYESKSKIRFDFVTVLRKLNTREKVRKVL